MTFLHFDIAPLQCSILHFFKPLKRISQPPSCLAETMLSKGARPPSTVTILPGPTPTSPLHQIAYQHYGSRRAIRPTQLQAYLALLSSRRLRPSVRTSLTRTLLIYYLLSASSTVRPATKALLDPGLAVVVVASSQHVGRPDSGFVDISIDIEQSSVANFLTRLLVASVVGRSPRSNIVGLPPRYACFSTLICHYSRRP